MSIGASSGLDEAMPKGTISLISLTVKCQQKQSLLRISSSKFKPFNDCINITNINARANEAWNCWHWQIQRSQTYLEVKFRQKTRNPSNRRVNHSLNNKNLIKLIKTRSKRHKLWKFEEQAYGRERRRRRKARALLEHVWWKPHLRSVTSYKIWKVKSTLDYFVV